MTDYTYKIIIHGTGLYREIQLKNDFAETVKIGTTKNCKVRLIGKNSLQILKLSLAKMIIGM